MPECTAAVTLAQLEIIREQVAHRDKMIRLLSKLHRRDPRGHATAHSRLLHGLLGVDVRHEHRPATVHLHGRRVRRPIGCRGDSWRVDRPVLSAARLPNFSAGQYAAQKKYPYSVPPASRAVPVRPGGLPDRPGSSFKRGSVGRRSARSTPNRTANWPATSSSRSLIKNRKRA